MLELLRIKSQSRNHHYMSVSAPEIKLKILTVAVWWGPWRGTSLRLNEFTHTKPLKTWEKRIQESLTAIAILFLPLCSPSFSVHLLPSLFPSFPSPGSLSILAPHFSVTYIANWPSHGRNIITKETPLTEME